MAIDGKRRRKKNENRTTTIMSVGERGKNDTIPFDLFFFFNFKKIKNVEN